MKLYENTLDRVASKIENKITGIIENNKLLLSQPGMDPYYRDVLKKDIIQAQKDLEVLRNAYCDCNLEVLENYSKLYLRENRYLSEADKSRFIKKFWDDAGCNGEDCRAHNRYELQQVIDFFNKYQNVKVDWQSKDTNILTLWNVMDAYYNSQAEKGGKDNAMALFKDTKKYQVMFETEGWLFVAPLNYEAAVEMDSYKIGGQGARWCIGTKGDSSYWERYVTREGSAFVMAYNKSSWAHTYRQKYMFQIQEGNLTVWPQDDNPNDTFGIDAATKQFPGITWEMVKGWWDELYPKIFGDIVPTVDNFDINKAMNRKQTYNLSKSTEYSTIHLKSFEVDTNFTTHWLKTQVIGIEKVNELYYSAKEYPMRSPDSEQVLLFPVFRCLSGNPSVRKYEITKPKISLDDLDMIGIGKFFISSEDRGPRLWFKTKKLMINNLYIPQDSNEKELHEMLEGGASAVDVFKRFAELSGAIDLRDVGEITVNNLFFNSSEYSRVPEEMFEYDQDGVGILDLLAGTSLWKGYLDEDGNLDVKRLMDDTGYFVDTKMIIYNLPMGVNAYWESSNSNDPILEPGNFRVYHCINTKYSKES